VETPRSVTQLTDPRALRLYAHPVRMALVGLLRTEGAMTASRAAGLLGVPAAACIVHLRQLARYGLVAEEEADRGAETPWRATAMTTSWSVPAGDPEMAAAVSQLSSIIAERYFEQLTDWLDRGTCEPASWRQAALFGDTFLHVTAAELAEIGRRIRAVLAEYEQRQVQPELRPAGARLVTVLQLAFPNADDFR